LFRFFCVDVGESFFVGEVVVVDVDGIAFVDRFSGERVTPSELGWVVGSEEDLKEVFKVKVVGFFKEGVVAFEGAHFVWVVNGNEVDDVGVVLVMMIALFF